MRDIFENIKSEKLYENLLFLTFILLSSIFIDPAHFSWSYQVIGIASVSLILILTILVVQIINAYAKAWKVFLILGIPFFVNAYIDFFYYRCANYPVVTTIQIMQLLSIYLFTCLMYVSVSNKKFALFLWMILIYIPEVLNVISFNFLGRQMTMGFVCTILNTDFQEMIFALTDYHMYIIGSLFLVFLLFYYSSRLKNLSKNNVFLCFSVVFFFAGLYFPKWLPIQIIARSMKYYILDLKELKEYREKHIPMKNINSRLSEKQQTYVLVIGESVDRKHMQIYGYDRETTPYFSKMKDELFVFRKVNAAYTLTNQAVKSMVYFRDKEQRKINLLQFFRDAGFTTFWYSNQGKTHFLII